MRKSLTRTRLVRLSFNESNANYDVALFDYLNPIFIRDLDHLRVINTIYI